jgi:UDP-2-acetamido-3-amino-2,3-dideoxy-glucuronate N-acetyltransferase
MRVAILGAGGWGKNHVRTFCALLGTSNVVVCDPDESRRSEMRTAHPGIETSAEPLYEDADAVVVAAPAALHYELAKQALAAGKHVLVEKPIAMIPSEAEDLVERADACGRILMVDHLLEYHPAVTRLKELVDAGELGRLFHLRSQRLNLGVIRTEENALWSLAPHDVSVMLYLVGEEPIEVAAYGATFLQPGIADVAHVTLRFPGGSLGDIHVSWLDPVKTRRLTVVGDRAMAVFDDLAEAKLVRHEACVRLAEGRFVLHRGQEEAIVLEDAEPLVDVARAFINSVATGESPRADGRDGVRVVRVLTAAQASMDRNGAPVRLTEGR